ncbi:uncharacterized protein kif16bb [Salarias fasciatus]|uniref:uncharacterized protein kif16bb n=1 Tax=Salarias fasciatus TaxID=181472 RepID=UPI0011769EBB|nr:uncharacterized protein LOC115399271 [Salarias fasciatus]
MSSVRVAVRVRPLNKREKKLSSQRIIQMNGNTVSIHKSSLAGGNEQNEKGKSFTYDFSYDSSDRQSPTFVSQERIFQDLGCDVLKAAFEGFNACVFAYGQTGSGKTHTMMGHEEDRGLIPRVCEGLYREMAQRSKTDVSFHTEVSYLEIYNERVQDLLKKKTLTEGGLLKVREHPKHGPYVENLSKHLVHSHSDMEELIVLGNAHRTTAATGMNDSSSRSHAIFTIMFTQAWLDAELPRETLSKIHLVDLAGSEKADATRTTGIRLKEGANINKSLVTLGSVISALADLGVGEQSTKKQQLFIPYRNSVLTWLLRDSLGGNAVTTMIATISPADLNYMETLSTLRYASRAKNIVNSPTVNEGGSAKVIRELQAEVKRLQQLLEERIQVFHEKSPPVKVKESLHQNESKGGALCLVNGSVVTDSCQLTQGAIIQLGRGTRLRFNHPAEASQLREKNQSGLLSATTRSRADLSTPTENQSRVELQNGRRFEEELSQREVGWKHTPERLNRCNGDIKRPPKESSGVSHQQAEEEEIERAESSLFTQMNMLAADAAEAEEPHISFTSTTTQEFTTTAIPGRHPVPHTGVEVDGDSLQGGVNTRDGQEQERDSCHKSGPRLQTQAQTEAGFASYKGEEFGSGDASLQQTSVLGLGDGCGVESGGNANEIHAIVTGCYKERPDSGGSSLGSMSHLQSGGSTRSTSVLPRTLLDRNPLSRQAVCSTPKETTFKDRFSCGEMDKSGELGIPGVDGTQTAAATVKNSRLGSLFSRVSLVVQDAGRFIWSAPTALQQITEVGLRPTGSRWSSQVISLVLKSNALPVVMIGQVFSVVGGSFVFSLLRDNHIFSMVKDLPLIQHIQMNITQHLQPKEAAHMIQSCIKSEKAQLPAVTPRKALSRVEELPSDVQPTPKDIWEMNGSPGDLQCPGEPDTDDVHLKQQERNMTELLPMKHIESTHATENTEQALEQASEDSTPVEVSIQTLIEFPDLLSNLQTLSLPDMTDALTSVISAAVLNSQKIVGLHWLNAAKRSQPEPRPALLILTEAGLYTLTADSGRLVVFHRLPLLRLKEIRIGLAGQSVRLMGTTEESILGVYTYSQSCTKELCRAILEVSRPGNSRVSQSPLLSGNLMKMSLDWQISVPDLLLDAGLRVCCQFQKSLADLVYLLHCNMDKTAVRLGGVQLLLYTSVAACVNSGAQSERLAQFLLTDTHFGLVREDAVVESATVEPSRPRFHDLTLRRCSDLRCILVHDEDERGCVRLDLILTNARGRGHPESVPKAASPSARVSDSSSLAEVWKLTFRCSAEAACLINHLSNV